MRILEGFQKGINLGGWLSQCVSYDREHFDTFITEKDIERIASWGLDHVRLPIDYDVIEDENGNDIEEGFAHIDKCVEWCKKYGLNIMLDVHKTFGYMFDTNEVSDPDRFFYDEELQNRFIDLWQKLATRYGKFQDMMAYELLNEVVNPDVAEIWNGIAKRTIIEIRKIIPEAYIVVGGVCYNNVTAIPLLDPPYDDKIVYNFHCYDPVAFTHQKAYWVEGMTDDFEVDYPGDLEELRAKSRTLPAAHAGAIYEDCLTCMGPGFFEMLFKPAVETAEKYNVPVYCGEYGVIDQAPLADSVRWMQDIHSVFEKCGIGRALWNYKNKDFGLVDEHYDEVRDEFIKLL